MFILYVTAFLLPFLMVLLLTPHVIRFAVKIGATDAPGERKVHKTIIPRIGGLGIFIALAASITLISLVFPTLVNDLQATFSKSGILIFCFASIFLLGFWDDLKPLKPGIKFGIQFIIAGLIYYAGFKISNITNPIGGGILNVELIDFPLTLLWIVGITNAFNLIDGLDGLASGVATIACFSIFTVSALSGQIWAAVIAITMAGALIGFLKYNFNPARIFLGDSGSLVIGFALALLSIQSTTKITTGFALLFPMLVLALPITDTLISMTRRFLGSFLMDNPESRKNSLLHRLHNMFTPDKSHIHHQLLSLGLTHRNAVLLLYVVSAFFAIGAFAFTQIDTIEQSVAVTILLGIALFLGIKKLRYYEIAIFNNGLMMPLYERWILNRTIFLSLLDLLFIVMAYSISYTLIKSTTSSSFEFIPFNQTLMLIISVQLFTFWITGLYREKLQQFGLGSALDITASVTYAVIVSGFILYALETLPVSFLIPFLVFEFYILLSFVLGFRMAYKALSFWFNRDKKSGENVLIYGANENGTMVLHKINNSPKSNIKVVGFLDDDPQMEGKLIYGYPILGGHWKLAKTLISKKVDTILVCEDGIKDEDMSRLKSIAENKGIVVKRLHFSLEDVFSAPVHNPVNNPENSIKPITSFT